VEDIFLSPTTAQNCAVNRKVKFYAQPTKVKMDANQKQNVNCELQMTTVTGAHPTPCVINNVQRDTYSANMRIKIPRVAR
jgi:hypothetical protein